MLRGDDPNRLDGLPAGVDLRTGRTGMQPGIWSRGAEVGSKARTDQSWTDGGQSAAAVSDGRWEDSAGGLSEPMQGGDGGAYCAPDHDGDMSAFDGPGLLGSCCSAGGSVADFCGAGSAVACRRKGKTVAFLRHRG